MKRVSWLVVGLALGAFAMSWLRPEPKSAWAGNDRHEDYILATGPIKMGVNLTADGIWILDYRAGKLLGTIVDPGIGKVLSWAEVDLVKEFNIPPKQNVHFLMTTGAPIAGNTAVYLCEINTGQFRVYTMAPRLDGIRGMTVLKHDATLFRAPPPQPK